MQFIPMNVLEYRFNEEGITTEIVVAFERFQGNQRFSSRVNLTQDYVSGIREDLDLNRLNMQQIEQYARLKLRDWILTQRPSGEPEDEEEPVEEE